MENIKIKNYYNKMSEDTKIILVNILADNLIYLHDFEVVDKKVIKSISSLLLLFINHNTKTKIKEFDEFSIYEKKVLYSIIIDGIASIYVDNEYLNYSDIGTKYKQKIIQECRKNEFALLVQKKFKICTLGTLLFYFIYDIKIKGLVYFIILEVKTVFK